MVQAFELFKIGDMFVADTEIYAEVTHMQSVSN